MGDVRFDTYYRGYTLNPDGSKIAIAQRGEFIAYASDMIDARKIVDGWLNAR